MMGRKRRHRKDLPPRVYFNHGAYYFAAKSGEWIWLSRDHATALRRYAEFAAVPIAGKMRDVMQRYMREIAPTKAPRTAANNEREIKPLEKVFGHMEPDEITPRDLYTYLDVRPKIAGNRELALLSSIFKHAIRWGAANDNPCRLVARNPERPRRRFVEAHEYRAVYAIAPPVIQCAMDLATQTGLRLSDLLKLNERDNVRAEGLYVETGKTGKRMLFIWTAELKVTVERCRGLRGKVRGLTLLCNRDGQRYTLFGFSTNWQRTMAKAIASGALVERFRFHDLRALAADRAEKPSELLGHDDPRVTNRIYRRGPRRVTPNK